MTRPFGLGSGLFVTDDRRLLRWRLDFVLDRQQPSPRNLNQDKSILFHVITDSTWKHGMRRKLLVLMATVVAGASFAGANGATGQTRVVSSDATARLVPLEIGKSIVIDLPADFSDVLVADPTIANVVIKSSRRVYIIALGTGQTNIAFYDAARRQIELLDVLVQKRPVLPNPTGGPANVVTMYGGGQGWSSLICTHTSNISEGAFCYPPPVKTCPVPWIVSPREVRTPAFRWGRRAPGGVRLDSRTTTVVELLALKQLTPRASPDI